MVGLVVVSHSRALADAAVALASEMVTDAMPPIAVAAGVGDDGFGTDATAVKAAIEEVDSPDGVVVFMDLGSAVLSAELAVDLLEPEVASRVTLTSAPLVEGLVAAVVQASGGASSETVVAEAAAGLSGKMTHLGHTPNIDATPSSEPTDTDLGEPTASTTIRIRNPHGLHARPAARLVSTLARFDAESTVARPEGAPVRATSLSRVAALGIEQGDKLVFEARGPEAEVAIEAVEELAAGGFGEDIGDDTGPELPPVPTPAESSSEDGHQGQGASPGVAMGPAVRLIGGDIDLSTEESVDPETAREALMDAIETVRGLIRSNRETVAQRVDADDAAIFEAHLALLDDTDLLDSVTERIDAGETPGSAWNSEIERVAESWAALDNEYLRARAVDVRDVGDRVLRVLLGSGPRHPSGKGILVVDDLTPSDAASLDPDLVQGIITAFGSATSHSAILSRSLGLPAVVGVGERILSIPEGTELIIDGDSGTVTIDPDPDEADEIRSLIGQRSRQRAQAMSHAHDPAAMTDGVQVEVLANIGSTEGADAALRFGAEGIGLLRTEFLFLDSPEPPDVTLQEKAYREIAETMEGRPLVVRTFDIGGDKPVPYMPIRPEGNPFLGMRGIRLALTHRDLLEIQLTAITRVGRDHPISVMFPMVTAVPEMVEARAIADQIAAANGLEGLEVGMMTEVPAAALATSAFVPHVDFFSIGTNDLTQYTVAADRLNEAVAPLGDPFQPAVLRLIKAICDQAADRHVTVCGESAADPVVVPILLGLGVGALSMSPPSIPTIKERIRHVDMESCRQLAADALEQPTAEAVRQLAATAFPIAHVP